MLNVIYKFSSFVKPVINNMYSSLKNLTHKSIGCHNFTNLSYDFNQRLKRRLQIIRVRWLSKLKPLSTLPFGVVPVPARPSVQWRKPIFQTTENSGNWNENLNTFLSEWVWWRDWTERATTRPSVMHRAFEARVRVGIFVTNLTAGGAGRGVRSQGSGSARVQAAQLLVHVHLLWALTAPSAATPLCVHSVSLVRQIRLIGSLAGRQAIRVCALLGTIA